MLTGRGWWLPFWMGAMLAAALPALAFWSPTLAILALTLLSWFLFEWLLFWFGRGRPTGTSPSSGVIHGDRELPNLWAGLDGVIRVRMPDALDRPTAGPG